MNVLLSGWVVAAGLVLAGASTPASALPIDPSLSVAGQTAAGLTPVQWMCDDLGVWTREVLDICDHPEGFGQDGGVVGRLGAWIDELGRSCKAFVHDPLR